MIKWVFTALSYGKKIVPFLSGNKLWLSIVLSAFLVGTYSGYKATATYWKSKELGIYKQWSKSLIDYDEKYRKREQDLLNQLEKSRGKTKTVIREIPKYVTPDGCTLSDDGVQHIRDSVKQLFSEAK